jgi:two-component system nitrate/nitrite sensor histidine kinase NarX
MSVPLIIQDRVIGMLGLDHSQPDYYTQQHAELVLTFANQAAMAMENARLYEQARELAAMRERQRLARDLHDAVSQTLFSASLSAEVLPRLWERQPEAGRQCLEELRELNRGALAEMRALLLELRPAALTETALGDLLGQLAEAFTSRTRVPLTLSVEGHAPLPPEVQVALYRIAQEALNNVSKHAEASQVTLSLRYRSYPSYPSPRPSPDLTPDPSPSRGGVRGEVSGVRRVELCISDDGRGFDPQNIPPQRLGVGIMRERAATIGAELSIQSQAGHGTRVMVVWEQKMKDE